MTYPSNVYFYDSNNHIIGEIFIDVGYFLDAETVAEELNIILLNNEKLLNNTSFIKVYYMRFLKEDLLRCSNIKELENLIDNELKETWLLVDRRKNSC